MKKILTIIMLFALAITCSAQQNNWEKWNWLLGEWQGEGGGQPRQGNGTDLFSLALDKNIIVRKSHSEYPTENNKPQIIHDDLMIIYPDMTNNLSKAIYFDNEGHVINYSIDYSDKTITLLSEKIPNMPVFRLTYTLLDDGVVNTKFEMSFDGENFRTHVEGKSKKIN